ELFGGWQIKNDLKHALLRVAYVVESPFCVMKFAQLGFRAVSPFGFSLSPEQVLVMSELVKGWVYLPDRNKFDDVAPSAGLLARSCWVRTPELPEGVDDPEHLSADQIRSLAGSSS